MKIYSDVNNFSTCNIRSKTDRFASLTHSFKAAFHSLSVQSQPQPHPAAQWLSLHMRIYLWSTTDGPGYLDWTHPTSRKYRSPDYSNRMTGRCRLQSRAHRCPSRWSIGGIHGQNQRKRAEHGELGHGDGWYGSCGRDGALDLWCRRRVCCCSPEVSRTCTGLRRQICFGFVGRRRRSWQVRRPGCGQSPRPGVEIVRRGDGRVRGRTWGLTWYVGWAVKAARTVL